LLSCSPPVPTVRHGVFFVKGGTTGVKDREGHRTTAPYPVFGLEAHLLDCSTRVAQKRSRPQILLARHLQHFHVIRKRQPPPGMKFHGSSDKKHRAGGNPRARHISNYSTIEATMPAPTVRPPSRIAKRSFSSMAIGTISSTSTVTLSPGITISVPSGSDTMPVTSVVRK
jgi:hypothetical protein